MSGFVRELESEEITKLRGSGQAIEAFVIPRIPNVIYTALLNGVPSTTDMVGEISFDGGSGTLANVRVDMLLRVGSSAGKDDLGTCRIRKLPIAGTFYISETSHVDWADNCFLTVVDDYRVLPRHLKIVDGVPVMEFDVEYDDQHTNFDPVVCMGGHVVKRLVGSSVSFTRDSSDSWVFDGTITDVLWEAPGSSGITGSTTHTPNITYNALGHYAIYCTVTADNGKTYTGVRYVFIVDPDLESKVLNLSIDQTIEDGVNFSFEMVNGCDLSVFQKESFVIAFKRDYVNFEEEDGIGFVEGEENVLGSGWLNEEEMSFNLETGGVRFVVSGAKYWLERISCFPFGLEESVGDPVDWVEMKDLNVDKAVWQLLHWRCTMTRIADFYPSDDERLAGELSSLNTTLGSQLVELATASIFGDVVFEYNGAMFLRVEPQLVPLDDRVDWVTVQEIEMEDLQALVDVVINSYPANALVNLSGVAVPQVTQGIALFSLSTGHIPMHYGSLEILERILLESQDQSNSLAGLMLGWHSSYIQEIRLRFIGNNRMYSLAQFCNADITIDANDNPRGVEYSGKIVPRSIRTTFDNPNGYAYTSITFQPESVERLAVIGDFPEASGVPEIDFSTPPMPKFPPLPPLDNLYLPPGVLPSNHPKVVLIWTSLGVFYSTNFHQPNGEVVKWNAMNYGLSALERIEIPIIHKTPSGALYCLTDGDYTVGWQKVMRASSVGAPWEEIFNASEYPELGSIVVGLGFNPTANDEIAVWGGRPWTFPIDGNTGDFMLKTFSEGLLADTSGTLEFSHNDYSTLIWADDKWNILCSQGTGLLGNFASPYLIRYDAGASFIDDENIQQNAGQGGLPRFGCGAGTQDLLFYWDNGGYAGFGRIINASITWETSLNPDPTQAMSFSPSGTHGMGHSGGTPYKTEDTGATWTLVSGTIPIGSDVWENCGDDFRWIFGGGLIVRLTMDRGATYIDKTGDLLSIAPLVDVIGIRYIS